jgi:L-rhamnose mutarotase
MKRYGSLIGSGSIGRIQEVSCRGVARGAGHDPEMQHPQLFHFPEERLALQLFRIPRHKLCDMARMAADPKTQEWWAIMMPMQRPLETREKDEWWAGMEEVFHLD